MLSKGLAGWRGMRTPDRSLKTELPPRVLPLDLRPEARTLWPQLKVLVFPGKKGGDLHSRKGHSNCSGGS